MKNLVLGLCLLFTGFCSAAQQKYPITLVIHGGAGTISRSNMTAEMEQAYTQGLQQALDAGYAILKSGGTSLDAVEAAVQMLEEDPLFNAGRGAVFTSDGRNELDAAIMDGKTGLAGAVAGVTRVRTPIAAARAVMEQSEHVLLIGQGAEDFAEAKGLELVDPSYFYTEPRYRNLQRAKEREGAETPDSRPDTKPAPVPQGSGSTDELILLDNKKYGTVGAVALDVHGNLAAATSTGGMNNKRYGRVGDVPIIGAGTYADNATCAVSATGHGEYFIRSVVAHDIASLIAYKKLTVKKASEEVVMKKLVKKGGEGGVIVLDRKGNFALTFNSDGMFRGYITADGKSKVQMYK